ncbi:TPA_exp: Uncharacterized protein A8136_5883 [Trichophyton benhamiae CBS 112371]|nr:TPA_exp: Uncharacterized protein A8136_5883 [Trichophyton benhamiae CBS 112371]
MHVHLRQDAMMQLVTPYIRKGGVDTVFVMPNLQPPVTTVAQAVEYRNKLQEIEPDVHYLMSLYLHDSITPDVIKEAAAAGITGVKVYPQGVTTNSAAGVTSLEDFYPVFEAMQEHDMVLNLHGEVPDVDVMNAEEAFLPTLKGINERFPKLRIVLEHCTTSAAVETVRSCGPTVAATITAHHLYLTVDDTVDPLAFCKPIAKTPADRDALIRAICSGDSKFFLDQPRTNQSQQLVFSPSRNATQYVLLALEDATERGIIQESAVTQERLEGFLSRSGRRFYKLPEPEAGKIILERKGETIEKSIKNEDGSVEVALSRGGAEIFSLRWA